MNIVEKYIAYLKDNPKGYWFRREVWGWGWTPARREGWLVVAAYSLYIVWLTTNFMNETLSGASPSDEPASFITKVLVATLVLAAFCYWKGEPPRFQWGFPKDRAD